MQPCRRGGRTPAAHAPRCKGIVPRFTAFCDTLYTAAPESYPPGPVAMSDRAPPWTNRWRRRGLLVLATASWLALLYALRFGWVEISAEADPCLRDPQSAACGLRAGFGLLVHLQIFGTAAIVFALAAHLRLGRWRYPCALVALWLALLALVLYNVSWGAPAAVIALLALADQGALGE